MDEDEDEEEELEEEEEDEEEEEEEEEEKKKRMFFAVWIDLYWPSLKQQQKLKLQLAEGESIDAAVAVVVAFVDESVLVQ